MALAVIAGALLHAPTPAEAQSAVLISNTGQTADSGDQALNSTTAKRAQAFTLLASASTAGYTVTSIGIAFHTIGNTGTAGSDLTVTLNDSSSGSPGTALCTFSNPSTFTASGVHTFLAPSTGTTCPLLTQNKTYFAVIERANGNTDAISLNTTGSTNEDSGGATGWSIANNRHWYTTAWGTTNGESHQIEITGHEGPPNNSATGVPTISGTPHSGEQLTADTSGIEDDDGLTNQNFSYKWVRIDGENETDIPNAANSSYTLTDDDAGKQVKVKVAFSDDRGFPEGPISSEPTETITTDTLASNTGQTPTSSGYLLNASFLKTAQDFTTGPNDEGYTLNSMGFAFTNISDTSTAGTDLQMTLNENNSGIPGDTLCTLTDPATFTASGLQTFNVPTTGTTCPILTKQTTYFVVVERVQVSGTSSTNVGGTHSDSEDTPSAPGWSIGDASQTFSGTTWTQYTNSYRIKIKGSVYVEPNVLVQNTKQTPTSSGYLLNASFLKTAQDFTTGPNDEGYTLNSMGFAFTNISDTSTAGTDLQMTLNENNSGIPGDTLCTLTDPATFTASGLQTFNVPTTGTTCPILTKQTTYFVVVERVQVSGTSSTNVGGTHSDSEDTPSAPGWSIGDASQTFSGTTWTQYTNSYRIKIKGSVFVDPETLVKNTAQTTTTPGESIDASFPKFAQKFTTGSDAEGYTLGSIGFLFEEIADTSTAASELTVKLYDEISGEPDTALCTLTDPSSYSASGLHTYDVPSTETDACPTLTTSTKYIVVIERANVVTDAITLAITNEDNDDAGAAAGWEIDDGSLVYLGASSMWTTATASFQVRVKGTALSANNDATGAPTITGTPRAGEVLTADTSAIEDDDGLNNVSYVYQWLHVDSMDEADITGATKSTYRLAIDDVDKNIKVKVTFNDDLGNAEGPLFSVPTEAISEGITLGTTSDLIPTDLAGDRFRLIFVTYQGHPATSTDIENYNTYVQSQANASNALAGIKTHSSSFRVLGSTEAVDARDNTGTTHTDDQPGVPIYWLNGSKVADDYADLYDGTWDDEANPTTPGRQYQFRQDSDLDRIQQQRRHRK